MDLLPAHSHERIKASKLKLEAKQHLVHRILNLHKLKVSLQQARLT
jgi:hypothetical protein